MLTKCKQDTSIFPVFSMIYINLFYILLTALISALILITPVFKLAVTMGKLDQPDARKVHSNATPRLGGIAIFFAIILTVFLFCEMDRQIRGFLAGAVIIFITGLYDDLADIQPYKKLIGQFLAALAAVMIGDMSLFDVGDLFGTGEIRLGVWAVPFTVLAIVGVTNAVNLLDGLDGLAGGVSGIAAMAIGILAYATDNWHLLCLTIAMTGALLGFLKDNTYPARVFMGDSGSLLLGYCLAIFSIMLCNASNNAVAKVTPLIILAIPIVDTIVVMIIRLKNGRPLFAPDKSHIHHHLLSIGFNHKGTVIVIYCLSYLLAIVAVSCYRLPAYVQAGILMVVIALFCSLRCVAGGALIKRMPQLRSNQSLRKPRACRRLVNYCRYLLTAVKYLVIGLFFLTILLPVVPNHDVPVIAAFLAILSVALVFLTHDWRNRFLLFVLYFDGAFLIYQLENYGRHPLVRDMALNDVSHGLFLLLFVICGIKLFIHRRTSELMHSPLEFLLLFLMVSVPLLPVEFIARHHLLTVTAKSAILFTAYRMVLMHQAKRNRKIIMATLVALLVVALKVSL